MAKKTTNPCSQILGTTHPFKMHNIISVTHLRQLMNSRPFVLVDSSPGVYRWWFPKKEKDRILGLIGGKAIASQLNLLERKIGRKKYYALYFGESEKLKDRIQDHIKGPFSNSTFRRTLRAILAQGLSECCGSEIVDSCIDTCYWEWDYTSCHKEVEAAELCQKDIAYPLNIKINRTVPPEWLANLERLIEKMK